jgi:hypothetical protein
MYVFFKSIRARAACGTIVCMYMPLRRITWEEDTTRDNDLVFQIAPQLAGAFAVPIIPAT